MTGPESRVDVEWKKLTTVVVVILAIGIWSYYTTMCRPDHRSSMAKLRMPNRAIKRVL
jgi:hypothetical protein